MKKPKKTSRLFEGFMDEYTGKAEVRRVREAAKRETVAKKGPSPSTRSVVPSMSTYRVQALENENHALRMQLAAQQNVNVTALRDEMRTFEQEYNRPEVVEEEPKGRKIVLDP